MEFNYFIQFERVNINMILVMILISHLSYYFCFSLFCNNRIAMVTTLQGWLFHNEKTLN